MHSIYIQLYKLGWLHGIACYPIYIVCVSMVHSFQSSIVSIFASEGIAFMHGWCLWFCRENFVTSGVQINYSISIQTDTNKYISLSHPPDGKMVKPLDRRKIYNKIPIMTKSVVVLFPYSSCFCSLAKPIKKHFHFSLRTRNRGNNHKSTEKTCFFVHSANQKRWRKKKTYKKII
jgi:hypothetical protein